MYLHYTNSFIKPPSAQNVTSKYRDFSDSKERELRSQALDYLSQNSKSDSFQASSALNFFKQFDVSENYNSFASQLKQKKEFESIAKETKKIPQNSIKMLTVDTPALQENKKSLVLQYTKKLQSLPSKTSFLSNASSVQTFQENLTLANRAKYVNTYQENAMPREKNFAS